MYFEVKELKEYRTKSKKTPSFQINLSIKTRFKKGQSLAIVDHETLKEYLKNNSKETAHELEIYKTKCENLEKENNKYKNYIKKLPDFVELQEMHRRETQKLNADINEKDEIIIKLLGAYTDLYTRGLIGRVKNTKPDSYEIIKELKGTKEPILLNNIQDDKQRK